MRGHALRVNLGEGTRLRVLEDPFWKPLGSKRDEAHQHRHDVLSLLRERPADQLGGVVFLDLPNHVGVFELTQTKGEHPRCEAWNGTEETVEPVGPLPPDIPEDEKAPFPTEDSQARRDGAVLERDHGYRRFDGNSRHQRSPYRMESMALLSLKVHGQSGWRFSAFVR